MPASPETGSAQTGVIHDIGYQNYQGPRLGRGHVARALYTHSLRSAFGIGRRARSKILPMGLLGASCLAALILVIIGSQLPEPVLSSVGIVATFSYAVMAFVAIVAPELVSGDLRNHTLPLYFSRPLARRDYALTKFAALASVVFLIFGGALVVNVLGMAFATKTGFTGVLDAVGDFSLGVVAAVLHSLVLAAIALPLASLTGRRVFATGMIIGLFLIMSPVAAMLSALDSGTLGQLAGILDPVRLLAGTDSWIFSDTLLSGIDLGPVGIGDYGPVYAVVSLAVLVLGVALSVRRYRKVKA